MKSLLLAFLLAAGVLAQTAEHAAVSGHDASVAKLLSQMTAEEKITLIHGMHEDP